MRRWNSPSVNIVHGILALLNIGLGLFNLHGHANWKITVVNFVGGGFIVALNVLCGVHGRWRDAARAHILQLNLERQGMERMTLEEQTEAMQLAKLNLVRVAASMSARVGRNWDRATVKIGHYIYDVRPHALYRRHEHATTAIIDYTCLQVSRMPYPEQIAAVLLLLRNDPAIFDRWARHDAYYA